MIRLLFLVEHQELVARIGQVIVARRGGHFYGGIRRDPGSFSLFLPPPNKPNGPPPLQAVNAAPATVVASNLRAARRAAGDRERVIDDLYRKSGGRGERK